MKNKIEMTDKQAAETIKAALATEGGQKALLAAMDKLFSDGLWEIPDDAIAGKVTGKVNQLTAQVQSLTSLLGQLSAKVNGKPAPPTGRIDATESIETKKSK